MSDEIVLSLQTDEEIQLSLGSSGGGGTSDYNALTNKPTLNGVTISGDKTSADFGITAGSTIYHKTYTDTTTPNGNVSLDVPQDGFVVLQAGVSNTDLLVVLPMYRENGTWWGQVRTASNWSKVTNTEVTLEIYYAACEEAS